MTILYTCTTYQSHHLVQGLAWPGPHFRSKQLHSVELKTDKQVILKTKSRKDNQDSRKAKKQINQ